MQTIADLRDRRPPQGQAQKNTGCSFQHASFLTVGRCDEKAKLENGRPPDVAGNLLQKARKEKSVAVFFSCAFPQCRRKRGPDEIPPKSSRPVARERLYRHPMQWIAPSEKASLAA